MKSNVAARDQTQIQYLIYSPMRHNIRCLLTSNSKKRKKDRKYYTMKFSNPPVSDVKLHVLTSDTYKKQWSSLHLKFQLY